MQKEGQLLQLSFFLTGDVLLSRERRVCHSTPDNPHVISFYFAVQFSCVPVFSDNQQHLQAAK
jgi:hypothetical protein